MIDVVIPVFNRQQLAQEAVASVLAQTFKDFTIFLVDDNSQPPLRISEPHPQIHLLRLSQNRGPAAARNAGARAGKAPYIAFLDSDDLWHPQKLEAQLSFLRQNSSFNWIHTNETWLKNSTFLKPKKKHRKQGGIFLPRLFELCLISPSAVLFKRDFFLRHGGFNENFFVAEDYEFWLRLNLHHPIAFLDFPFTVKRAGAWRQLSSRIEIDRFRVLALHRFYRLYQHEEKFTFYFEDWYRQINRKVEILIKGAQKYGKEKRLAEYRAWQQVIKRTATNY